MSWKHDDLAADLAAYLNGPDLMVWTDMQLGPSGSPRPDVYTIRRSYSKPNPMAFECKISRSDLRSDTTSGKWQKYLKYAQGVVFAVPDGLCTAADIPDTCGLIVRKAEVWRYARRPTLQAVSLPMDACMKLLIDGVNRTFVPRQPQPRRAEIWTECKAVRQKFGAAVDKAARDLVAVEERTARLTAEARDQWAREEAAIAKRREAAIKQAQEEVAGLATVRAELTAVLGLSPTASQWSIQHAVAKLRTELSADDRVAAAERDIRSARAALEAALNRLPVPLPHHPQQHPSHQVIGQLANGDAGQGAGRVHDKGLVDG